MTKIRNIEQDNITGALVFIDYEHHEIHDGDHFFYTDKVTLGSAGTQIYLLTTPDSDTFIHMTFTITGSAITQSDIYEGADRVGTTLQTAYNSDRNSSRLPLLLIHKDISGGTTDGVLLWTMQDGSSQGSSRSGMSSQRDNEIILKQNTKYLLRVTSGTASNLTNLQIGWYSHGRERE
jgi:hypothetical protein